MPRSRALRRQRGQALVEYGLVLVLVAAALIASLIALQGPLHGMFNDVVNAFPATP